MSSLKKVGIVLNYVQKYGSNLSATVRYVSSTSTTNKKDREYDIVIVGGGIVGVATAREILKRHGNLRMAIVEKENKLAAHQSGHNSGVIHAGIYYTPGSLKAKLCVEGLQLAYQYFDEHRVPYKRVGKLIVATTPDEVTRLDAIYQRALQNRVPDVRLVNAADIREIEPHCVGLKAIWSPNTGIVDYARVTEQYAKEFRGWGGDVRLNFETVSLKEDHGNSTDSRVEVVSRKNETLRSRFVLTCGGLQADKLARLSGGPASPSIIPFRGEYLLLNEEKRHLVKGNIYPVPDPRFPFLGVHFTPRMDGSVWLGPNAVLAFRREGYNWTDVNVTELLEALRFPGFRRLAARHLMAGANELLRAAKPSLQVELLRRFIPELAVTDVTRGPAGVRAQALDSDGNLVDDFCFEASSRVLHCRNAPSPGATSSLAIARMVADKMEEEFGLGKV